MLTSIPSRTFIKILLATSILATTLLSSDRASAGDYSENQIVLNMKQEVISKPLANASNKQSLEARLFYRLGNLGLDSRDYDNAIECYQKSILLAPHFPPSYYNLGLAHLAIGNKEEAAEYFREYLKLRPNAFNAEEIRDFVKVLTK